MLTPRARIGQAVAETPERTPDPARDTAVEPSAEQKAPAKPRRKRTWYSVADVLLRRIALAAFVIIALVATIVAALGGR
jgi:hypothetical protein